MKIVHLYWRGPKEPGGISNMLIDELENASKTNEYFIIYLDDCDSEFAKRIPSFVKVFALGRKKNTGIIKAIWPLLKLNILLVKINPDLIIYQALELSKYVFYKRSKCIGRIHTVKIKNSFFTGSINHYIAISNAVKDDVLTRTNIVNNKISVVYNGVYTENFKEKESLFYTPELPLRLVHVSRLIHTKAHDLFLNVLMKCKEAYGFKNWTYTIIGAGEEEEKLKELSRKLNLDDRVLFLGQVSREYLYNNLKDYDLFVLPSRFEGLGNVLIEAMSAKLPILCSNVDGPKEILCNDQHGYTFISENIDDCANALFEIYKNYGNEEMKRKVDKAYSFAQKEMDISVMVRNLENIYNKVFIQS